MKSATPKLPWERVDAGSDRLLLLTLGLAALPPAPLGSPVKRLLALLKAHMDAHFVYFQYCSMERKVGVLPITCCCVLTSAVARHVFMTSSLTSNLYCGTLRLTAMHTWFVRWSITACCDSYLINRHMKRQDFQRLDDCRFMTPPHHTKPERNGTSGKAYNIWGISVYLSC